MGWKYTHILPSKKEDEVLKIIKNGINGMKLDVLKLEHKTSVYYAAVREAGNEKADVFGVIVPTAFEQNEYYNLCYRIIRETEAPRQTACSSKLLRLLSPTDDKNANKWRSLVMENVYEKSIKMKHLKQLRSVPVGGIIKSFCFGDDNPLTLKKIIHQNNEVWVDSSCSQLFKKTDIIKRDFLIC